MPLNMHESFGSYPHRPKNIRATRGEADRRDATRRDGPSDRARRDSRRSPINVLGRLVSRASRHRGPELAPSSSSSPSKKKLPRPLHGQRGKAPRLLDTGHQSIHLSNDERPILSRFPSIMIMKRRRFPSFLSILRLGYPSRFKVSRKLDSSAGKTIADRDCFVRVVCLQAISQRRPVASLRVQN